VAGASRVAVRSPEIGAKAPLTIAGSSSAWASASPSAGRSAGSLARQRITRSPSASGTPARSARTSRGASARCAANTARAGRPANGGAPASSSYAVTPNAYTSAAGPMSSSALTCSGAMYAGVPSAVPTVVSAPVPAAVALCRRGRVARRGQRLGHAEVGHHRRPAGEQDVVGLDVAVHDAAPVRHGEGARHVAQDAHGLGHGRAARSRARPQRGARRRTA
jgi:hypothetical protein